MSVGDQVMDIIAEKLDVARDKVKAEAILQTDLGADSLDIVELLMHLEDNFGIKIPDEDAEKIEDCWGCHCLHRGQHSSQGVGTFPEGLHK